MAPPKVPKKPLKSMAKPIEKPISKIKKTKKKRNYGSFSIYIYKLLRTVATDLGISKKSILIMDGFVNDMLEKIAAEAGRLVAQSKKTTMTSRDVQTAVRLLLPGELVTHANIEGLKAIALYHKSRDTQST